MANMNCKMAFEVEKKHLDKKVALDAITYLINNPNFGYFINCKVVDEESHKGQLAVLNEFNPHTNELIYWLTALYVDPDYRKKRPI